MKDVDPTLRRFHFIHFTNRVTDYPSFVGHTQLMRIDGLDSHKFNLTIPEDPPNLSKTKSRF